MMEGLNLANQGNLPGSAPINIYFYCGNSIFNSSTEQCDDGNYANSDGCSEF